jgi:protein ImuB
MSREAAPRVLALHLPDLPLQRAHRARAEGGAPLAVVAEGRVLHRDRDARAQGVRVGGTVSEALAACGRLVTVPLDPAADRAALEALAEAVLLLAPAVEVAPPDALLLDASAAALVRAADDPRDPELCLAERVLAAATEMEWKGRIAVATGRASARALARHGVFGPDADGRAGEIVRVLPHETARALARLPIEALGLEGEVARRLRALGVFDAGALARLPHGTLAHRFGPPGVRAARLARGEDDAPLVPHVPAALPEESIELEAPAESAEPLLFALKRLADRVAARLAGRGLGASRLSVVLALDPRGEERILAPLAQPSASAARWLLPLKEHLFSLRLPGAVTRVTLGAIEVARVEVEQLAFGDRPEALAALDGVLARLAVRLGDGALFAAEPVERYRPEEAYRAVPFRPGEARSRAERHARGGKPRKGAARGARSAGAKGAATGSPRTATATAPADDGAGAHAPAGNLFDPAEPREPLRPTRLLAPPERVVAEGEGGRVTALRVGGRSRAVRAMDGPERLRGEWWSSPYDRDYYRVRLDGLGDCWVYRDAGDGALYLHGFFD